MNAHNDLQHFILTRFNLLLWNRDKEGKKVRTIKWLEHRFSLFEKYCLPSIANQTSKNFKWIVLFDSSTPEKYKDRIVDLQSKCTQLIPVFVEPENGRHFAEIFRKEVVKRLNVNLDLDLDGNLDVDFDDDGNVNVNLDLDDNNDLELNVDLNGRGRVLTTYLDNDDALNVRFVEDVQRRAKELSDGTFIYYTDGLQFFTDHSYLMQIHYRRNHFVSVVESGDPSVVRTIYGYGSHYYIDQMKGAEIEYVDNLPMWCEVIHEKNMGNDAYFLRTKMVRDSERLRHDFAIDETVEHGAGLYLFRFLPRYGKTFIRRCGHRLFGRHW